MVCDVVLAGKRKTGTTFLRDEVLNKISSVNVIVEYVGFDGDISVKELKSCYPDAMVLFGVRNMDSWIHSYYNLMVKQGEFHSFGYWYTNIFNKRYLKIDDVLINELKMNFDKVFVYIYEDMLVDMDGFIKGLCCFLGVDVPFYKNRVYRKSWNDNQLKLACFINRFVRSSYNPSGIFRRGRFLNSNWLLWRFGSNYWLFNK